MKHIFDVEIAEQYGINAAILLENLSYWIKKNEANGTNFYDNNFWTFNSRRALKEMFPYMSERQISSALKKLIDADLVVTGNYNKLPYDRTLWYALTQKGKSILRFCKMDYHNMSNDILRFCKMDYHNMSNELQQNVSPIPDINTDINTDIKEIKKNSFDEIISSYTSNEKTIDLLREWLKVRKAKRVAMTDREIRLNVEKLDVLAKASDMSVDDYLTEVICRGWSAFYEIKQYGNTYKNSKFDIVKNNNVSYDINKWEHYIQNFNPLENSKDKEGD